jgi:hypothetical protein
VPEKPLEHLPFRFERRDGDYLVSNMVGDFVVLTHNDFDRLVDLRIAPGDGLYEKAYAAHLIAMQGQQAPRQLLAVRLRSRMAFLRQMTPLHLFVVTLRCEHSCPYCQVSRQSTDRSRYDMSEETAQRALKIALDSPCARLKIEFQGGEPLLNFSLIEKIVLAAKAAAPSAGKKLDFVIASNLALLTDDHLRFCKAHDVLLSTSLDGPADLHNKNRPRPGSNSHELAVKGIRRAQEFLGADRVGALMTTTGEQPWPRYRDCRRISTARARWHISASTVAIWLRGKDQTIPPLRLQAPARFLCARLTLHSSGQQGGASLPRILFGAHPTAHADGPADRLRRFAEPRRNRSRRAGV